MVVLVLKRVPRSLRGELSRWMLELGEGVFVGSPSALVRDKLWEMVCEKLREGRAVMAHTTASEQGFAIRLNGDHSREVADFDGLILVRQLATPAG
jgi:CRISPR-associated protein Cas2